MKRFAIALLLAIPILFSYCSKNGGSEEENLRVALDPNPGSSVVKALGSSYSFKVIIQSKMPSGGVDVNVAYRKDSDNSVLFSQTVQSSTTPVNLTVNNIPFNEVGTVTAEVKSRSKSSNTATVSFKLTRK